MAGTRQKNRMLNWLLQNWRDASNVVGFVLNVAGIVLTIYVFFASKRAEQAAQEAKRSIEKRSVATDLRDCSEDLSLMTSLCDNSSWAVAAFICSRLTQRLSFISHRWVTHFADDTKDGLNLLIQQLDALNTQLHKFSTRPPKPAELQSLTIGLRKIGTLFAAQLGKYESLIEK